MMTFYGFTVVILKIASANLNNFKYNFGVYNEQFKFE